MEFSNFSSNFKNYSLIVTLVSFLIVALLVGFSLFPKWQTLTSLQQEIAANQSSLQLEQAYISQLNTAKNKLAGYQAELAKVDSSLPNDPSLPALFNFIQKASSQAGLVVNDIGSFAVAQDASGTAAGGLAYNKISFSVSVSGPYSAFKSFISSLEKTARLIEIEGLNFSAALTEKAGERAQGTFSFNLSLNTHSR